MRILIGLLAFFVATASAEENQTYLKDRPGKNQVATQCVTCHSLDYITRHAAILDRAGWEKTVSKMINTMGAPVNNADKQIIIDYLGQHYGR